MISYLLVTVSFGMMFLSDLLKLAGHCRSGKYLLLAGMMALVAAGINAAMSSSRFQTVLPLKILFLLISLAAAALEYRALFSSLPVIHTYLGNNEPTQLVDSGMYALCRHPGALWFPLFSVSLAIGLGNWELLASAGLASLLNLWYVWFQDLFIFPRTIAGYRKYQESTPFLIPTAQSISCTVGKNRMGR
jgi:protein-S-isoprenylcysteine O-methyltransferase Ste14